RHTRFSRDWSSDVCSSDLSGEGSSGLEHGGRPRSVVVRAVGDIVPVVVGSGDNQRTVCISSWDFAPHVVSLDLPTGVFGPDLKQDRKSVVEGEGGELGSAR